MRASGIDEPRARWVIADFASERCTRHAAEVLQNRGYVAHVTTPSSALAPAADEGIAVVRIGRWAWLGLLVGVLAGLVLGRLLWNGQLVVPLLAPALSSGRTAVPILLMGILGAIGWLIGALLPLGLERPVSQVVVCAPAAESILAVERQLVDLGAWNVCATPPSQGDGEPPGPR